MGWIHCHLSFAIPNSIFSINFINDLLKEVEKAKLGIQLGEGGKIGGMLFADDYVGLSDSKEQLQKLIDVIYDLFVSLELDKAEWLKNILDGSRCREGNKECGNECESVSLVLWECSA